MPNTVYFWNQIILWYKSKYESQERNYFGERAEKPLTNNHGCVSPSVLQFCKALSKMTDSDWFLSG